MEESVVRRARRAVPTPGGVLSAVASAKPGGSLAKRRSTGAGHSRLEGHGHEPRRQLRDRRNGEPRAPGEGSLPRSARHDPRPYCGKEVSSRNGHHYPELGQGAISSRQNRHALESAIIAHFRLKLLYDIHLLKGGPHGDQFHVEWQVPVGRRQPRHAPALGAARHAPDDRDQVRLRYGAVRSLYGAYQWRGHALLHHADLERGGDRKSTRLNSSHSSISYDVLCLNK